MKFFIFLSLLYLPIFCFANTAQVNSSTLDQHSDRIAIISPKNNQTLQNERHISVHVAVYPKLKPGDKVTIYVDKKPNVSASSTVLKIFILDRGKHQIDAELIRANRQIAHSQSIKIFLHLKHITHDFSNLNSIIKQTNPIN